MPNLEAWVFPLFVSPTPGCGAWNKLDFYWFLVISITVAFVVPCGSDDFPGSSQESLLFVPSTLVELLKHQALPGEAWNVRIITGLLIGDWNQIIRM